MPTTPAPDLVGTTTSIAPSELRTYHRNPRRGDVAAIAASLRAHDQYRPITVNIGTYTGRANEVLTGNHTLLAIRDLAAADPDDPRWQAVKVHWGDWDEQQCRSIVLADNRTSELGGVDYQELYDVLRDMPDLDGTGYDADYLRMLQEMAAGPPDLDDLAHGYGDPLPEDGYEVIRLRVPAGLARRWQQHRDRYADDLAALEAVL